MPVFVICTGNQACMPAKAKKMCKKGVNVVAVKIMYGLEHLFRYLSSNFSCLLLSSPDKGTLVCAEGWNSPWGRHVAVAGPHELLGNLLSHLGLSSRRCIHFVQLRQRQM